MNKGRNGFTLAEVLITLTVIGIVAAMSIPSLIAKVDNQSYITGLQKFYAVFSQALQKYAADEGSVGDLNATSIFTNCALPATCNDHGDPSTDYPCCTPDIAFTWNVLGKYFNQIKDCSSSDSNDCWPNETQNLLGSDGDTMNVAGANATLGDGMSINLVTYGDCIQHEMGINSPTYNTCGQVIVDVNGKKPPNRWGRDTFQFFISREGRLIPAGSYIYPPQSNYSHYGGISGGWKSYCNKSSSGWGNYCTARVLEEGWQMNY